jgi:hypothetical protein
MERDEWYVSASTLSIKLDFESHTLCLHGPCVDAWQHASVAAYRLSPRATMFLSPGLVFV